MKKGGRGSKDSRPPSEARNEKPGRRTRWKSGASAKFPRFAWMDEPETSRNRPLGSFAVTPFRSGETNYTENENYSQEIRDSFFSRALGEPPSSRQGCGGTARASARMRSGAPGPRAAADRRIDVREKNKKGRSRTKKHATSLRDEERNSRVGEPGGRAARPRSFPASHGWASLERRESDPLDPLVRRAFRSSDVNYMPMRTICK